MVKAGLKLHFPIVLGVGIISAQGLDELRHKSAWFKAQWVDCVPGVLKVGARQCWAWYPTSQTVGHDVDAFAGFAIGKPRKA